MGLSATSFHTVPPSIEYSYREMASPPLDSGACQETVIIESPATTLRLRGTLGTVEGMPWTVTDGMPSASALDARRASS